MTDDIRRRLSEEYVLSAKWKRYFRLTIPLIFEKFSYLNQRNQENGKNELKIVKPD